MQRCIPRKLIVSLLCLLSSADYVSAQVVGSKSPGKWVQARNFVQLNIGCLAAFECTPGKDILYGSDTVVKTTPSASSIGICNAGGGPADSCNICAANPPQTKCEYWLEKKP